VHQDEARAIIDHQVVLIEAHWCAHLPMGILTGIVANIADQEIGATKVDPRLLQAAETRTHESY
jgi:formylmethanofuran dehydrogenase subunit E